MRKGKSIPYTHTTVLSSLPVQVPHLSNHQCTLNQGIEMLAHAKEDPNNKKNLFLLPLVSAIVMLNHNKLVLRKDMHKILK